VDFKLETLGWKNFQDLALTICSEQFGVPVASFSPGADQGEDGRAYIRTEIDREWASVQAKHFSSRERTLRRSDVEPEYPKVQRLAAEGMRHYFVYTNASVTAALSRTICLEIQELGVADVQIFGRETLERLLLESPKLRGLVPRVYGLGDLSEILDSRLDEQSRLLVEEFALELVTYQPTTPYFESLSAISDFQFCLLLGEPGSGKSAIARAIAVYATDNWRLTPAWLSNLDDFEEHWNPKRRDQFFIIDDVFGSTSTSDSAVESWNRLVPRIQAAIHRSDARFLLTSRDYIFASAKGRLKRNQLPVSREGEVVIDVQTLTAQERRSIAYSHLKYGRQPRTFLVAVKEHLHEVCATPRFLPETARRLGDPLLTAKLDPSNRAEIKKFVEEPREHLAEVIESLPSPFRNALVVLASAGGSFECPVPQSHAADPVLRRFEFSPDGLGHAFAALEGGLISRTRAVRHQWVVRHPTVLDSTFDVLGRDPQTLDIYVANAPLQSVLEQTVCGASVRGAIEVPVDLLRIVKSRMVEDTQLPPETQKYHALVLGDEALLTIRRYVPGPRTVMRYLAYRCGPSQISQVFDRNELSDVFASWSYASYDVPLEADAAVRLLMRLWYDGLASERLIKRELERIVNRAIYQFDPYPFTNPNFEQVFVEVYGDDAWVEDVVLPFVEFAETDLGRVIGRMKLTYEDYLDRAEYFAPIFGGIETLLEWVETGTRARDALLRHRRKLRAWVAAGGELAPRPERRVLPTPAAELSLPGANVFADLDE
jgi:hypothetical protein